MGIMSDNTRDYNDRLFEAYQDYDDACRWTHFCGSAIDYECFTDAEADAYRRALVAEHNTRKALDLVRQAG